MMDEIWPSGYTIWLSMQTLFNPSILRYSVIWGAADEAVLNEGLKKSPLIMFTVKHAPYLLPLYTHNIQVQVQGYYSVLFTN